MNLDPLEISAVIILLLSVLLGLKRGFFSEVFALIIWLLAFAVGALFYPLISEFLTPHFGDYYSTLIGFVGLSLAMIIVGAVIHLLIRLLAFATHISALSRLAGAVVGAVKGCLVIAWIVFIMASTPLQSHAWFEKSPLTYQLGPLTSWLQGMVFKQQTAPNLPHMDHLNKLKAKLEQR